MASILQQPALELEYVVEMLLRAVVLAALGAALVAILHAGWTAGSRWTRHRRSPLAPWENTFVGRSGRAGPELFVVGAGARRLPLPHGHRPPAWRHEAGQVRAVLATTMLTEAMGRQPSRELAWAFAEDRMAYLPVDGFVLETSEVLAWLDARHAGTSALGTRAGEAASACAAWVASRIRPARRPKVEGAVPGREVR
ncbi:MAG: hypothetical protein M3131_06615 [Actinomycetota bacterium]|nr:hypothetical protein [Actinomycetota bacterium]